MKDTFVFNCNLLEEVTAKNLLLENMRPSMLECGQTMFWSSGKSGCEISWPILLCRFSLSLA